MTVLVVKVKNDLHLNSRLILKNQFPAVCVKRIILTNTSKTESHSLIVAVDQALTREHLSIQAESTCVAGLKYIL